MKKATIDINRILDVALEMFVSDGLGGTRIEAVAKKSGYGYGTVYYYFPKKEQLYNMTAQRAMDHYAGISPGASASAYEGISSYLKMFFSCLDTASGARELLLLYDVLISESAPPTSRLYVQEKFGEIRTVLRTLIEGCQAEGRALERDADELTNHIVAMMIGGAFLRISGLGPAPDPEAILADIMKKS